MLLPTIAFIPHIATVPGTHSSRRTPLTPDFLIGLAVFTIAFMFVGWLDWRDRH